MYEGLLEIVISSNYTSNGDPPKHIKTTIKAVSELQIIKNHRGKHKAHITLKNFCALQQQHYNK